MSRYQIDVEVRSWTDGDDEVAVTVFDVSDGFPPSLRGTARVPYHGDDRLGATIGTAITEVLG